VAIRRGLQVVADTSGPLALPACTGARSSCLITRESPLPGAT
jgi:hypothetical protein